MHANNTQSKAGALRNPPDRPVRWGCEDVRSRSRCVVVERTWDVARRAASAKLGSPLEQVSCIQLGPTDEETAASLPVGKWAHRVELVKR